MPLLLQVLVLVRREEQRVDDRVGLWQGAEAQLLPRESSLCRNR